MGSYLSLQACYILTGCRQGTVEEKATVNVEAGKPIDIYVEYTNTPPPDSTQADMSQPGLMRGVVSIRLLHIIRSRPDPDRLCFSALAVP